MKLFFLYCIGGAVAALVHFGVLVGLVEWAGAQELHASMAGALAAIPVNFAFQYFLVFRSERHVMELFARYCAVTLFGFFLNAILFAFFFGLIGLYYLLAQVLTVVLILFVNFYLNSRWTFKTGNDPVTDF